MPFPLFTVYTILRFITTRGAGGRTKNAGLRQIGGFLALRRRWE